jgi:hypothetical protein
MVLHFNDVKLAIGVPLEGFRMNKICRSFCLTFSRGEVLPKSQGRENSSVQN